MGVRFLMLPKGRYDGGGLLEKPPKSSRSVRQLRPTDMLRKTWMNPHLNYFSEADDMQSLLGPHKTNIVI